MCGSLLSTPAGNFSGAESIFSEILDSSFLSPTVFDEWVLRVQQPVRDYDQGPPVDGSSISSTQEHFGSFILTSSLVSSSPRAALPSDSEVSNFKVVFFGDENVSRLHIAVEDVACLQILES